MTSPNVMTSAGEKIENIFTRISLLIWVINKYLSKSIFHGTVLSYIHKVGEYYYKLEELFQFLGECVTFLFVFVAEITVYILCGEGKLAGITNIFS